MFASQYYDSIKDILDTVYASEKDKIERAGRCVADTIMGDGLVHGFGCGHSHMLMEELFYRAGGLAAVDPLFEESAMLHGGAVKSSHVERMSGYAQFVIDRYAVKPGDTFLIASSSGINCFPIEMGEEAKKRGATVIGITSDHYRDAPSRDKQGRHLRDVCDFYINNHVPHGDAVVGVGEDVKAGPVSSISGFFIANSIILAACEELSRRGFTPPVFKSGNVAGGDSYNSQILGRYMSRIKHL